MTLRNYKFAVFSALVLSMIIPFAGINMAHATQTTGDPYHIGKVTDGTYNETAALQRATQLMKMYDEKTKEKQDLEKKLVASTLSDIETIKSQINNVQGQMDQIMQEIAVIQNENYEFYYVDPILREKYNTAANQFFNATTAKYWKGKSFEDDKNTFPLVRAGLDSKKKMVEITLWKGIENSPKLNQYIAMIKENVPTDVPWYISFGEYSTSYCADTRCNAFSPRIGGIDIGMSDGSQCTLGFKATRTIGNVLGFVTAGHCIGGLTGTSVKQPITGSAIGTASTAFYTNGVDCDCGFVILNSGVTISDAIYNTATSTYTPTSVTTQLSQAVGTLIKQSGITSGIQVGSVVNNDITDVRSDGTRINHSVQANIVSNPGDSGSPITKSDSTNSLYGELTSGAGGGVTFYSPENRVAADLGVTIAVG